MNHPFNDVNKSDTILIDAGRCVMKKSIQNVYFITIDFYGSCHDFTKVFAYETII